MSIRNQKWIVQNKNNTPGSIDETLDVLLKNRGISQEEIGNFINPPPASSLSYKDVGIEESSIKDALKLFHSAKKSQEGVLIYGDYDVDGICGTAIAWEALTKYGIKAYPYIPNRFVDGYGIKAKRAIELAEKHNTSIIMTVDNGITSVNEISKIKDAGLTVILTDHHTERENLPPADVIVHTKMISGAAVSWFLSRELDDDSDLVLAAIASVADQMTLIGPSRSLVKEGLRLIRGSDRPGLIAILEQLSLEREIGVYEIGFLIGPRINAAGRLEDGMDALRLLCTTNPARAKSLYEKLNSLNYERKELVDDAIKDAKHIVTSDKAIIVDGPYHEGVIGLIAGKLVEEYHRPAYVISTTDGTALKGSARSISGYHIVDSLDYSREALESYGGHAMAGGFSLYKKNLKKFKKSIQTYSDETLKDADLVPKLSIDTILDHGHVSMKLAENLRVFEPTGIGNPSPRFVSEGLVVENIRTVGKEGDHLKIQLSKDSHKLDGIAFGMGKYSSEIHPKDLISCVYAISINSWQGRESVQMVIKDIKHEKQ